MSKFHLSYHLSYQEPGKSQFKWTRDIKNANTKLREMLALSDKNCKATIIFKMLQRPIINTLETSEKYSLSKEIETIKKTWMENLKTQKYNNWNFKNSLNDLKRRMGKTEELVNMTDKRNYSIWTTQKMYWGKKIINRASETCRIIRKYLTFMSSEMQKEGKERMVLRKYSKK